MPIRVPLERRLRVAQGEGSGKARGALREALGAAVATEAARAALAAQEGAEAYPEHVYESIETMDEERVNIDAIAALVWHLDAARPPGAILVFMPGAHEIMALHAALSVGSPSSRTVLPLPLHSTIAQSEQLAVFQRPPHGQRKVVIATNIAETSITIDDIIIVRPRPRLAPSGLMSVLISVPPTALPCGPTPLRVPTACHRECALGQSSDGTLRDAIHL